MFILWQVQVLSSLRTLTMIWANFISQAMSLDFLLLQNGRLDVEVLDVLVILSLLNNRSTDRSEKLRISNIV